MLLSWTTTTFFTSLKEDSSHLKVSNVLLEMLKKPNIFLIFYAKEKHIKPTLLRGGVKKKNSLSNLLNYFSVSGDSKQKKFPTKKWYFDHNWWGGGRPQKYKSTTFFDTAPKENRAYFKLFFSWLMSW